MKIILKILLSFLLKDALLQFEVSPFRIRKADVVIMTTGTLNILEKPRIEVCEARFEYHFDDTSGSAQTQAFIAGVFIVAGLRLDVTLSKGTKHGLVLEGHMQDAGNVDFEQAAKQLSPEVPFSLPKKVALSSISIKLEKSQEITSLRLEGHSHANWSIDVGFGTITIKAWRQVEFSKGANSRHVDRFGLPNWRGSLTRSGRCSSRCVP